MFRYLLSFVPENLLLIFFHQGDHLIYGHRWKRTDPQLLIMLPFLHLYFTSHFNPDYANLMTLYLNRLLLLKD